MSQQLIPLSFTLKKQKILSQLNVPIDQYDDLSPKGSIDVNIRDLIEEINEREGWVTTSSCGGRVSVFLEGRKGGENEDGDGDGDGNRETVAKIGGKGGGGRWLFVSHDPIPLPTTGIYSSQKSQILNQNLSLEASNENKSTQTSTENTPITTLFGLQPFDPSRTSLGDTTTDTRFVHFKFEPMILHILTSSLSHAQSLLTSALQSGFRESGALNLSSPSATPMVGIRSMGFALESIVGFYDACSGEIVALVPEWQLKCLVEVANERFVENGRRIERFRGLVRGEGEGKRGVDGSGVWEDKDVRRERKREEGLRLRAEKERGDSKKEKEEDDAAEIDIGIGVLGIEND